MLKVRYRTTWSAMDSAGTLSPFSANSKHVFAFGIKQNVNLLLHI